ncbi:TPA: hypothetical protein MDK39_004035 [Citrobacter freundii]|uniref:hypothetical protein n=1 Tax=Citrobacter freundii TaxID=546 RepID=UPI0027E8A599|nr:hypothetical protein [Citrobacter freundii]ELA3554108.1 hypothetical protein [Citrobacter freundii]HBU6198295.1 hypothetical protein [Citrobacter freundii]HBU9825613.1 hypothetical protein [Citrobacter freundii]HBU9835177.1 hypothetical protein [Citrobacter freundii]
MKQIAQENIIELVKLGHERAAELKASCGAVDVRSLAQLISDLATQLEVQYVRAENAQREFRSADITMQNLEAKCEKLAAENAGLKAAFDEPQAYLSWHAIPPTWEDPLPCGEYLDVHDEAGHKNSDGTDCWPVFAKPEIETPATSAFLAEVRSQARNEGINYAASRLAAAFNHGFLDKPVAEVLDVTRMILSTKEDLANDSLPATDGLSGEYAEKATEDWAAQLRKGAEL